MIHFSYLNKYILSVAALSMAWATAEAVPALRRPMLWTQPDGTRLEVTPCGDEHLHCYLTSTGDTLVAHADGWLTAPSYSEMLGRRAAAEASRAAAAKGRVAASQDCAAAGKPQALSTGYPTHGKQKTLVVLVEFADNHFTVPDPQETFSRMLNETGFCEYGATGSAKDYFLASSNGEFEPEFDVYGPVKLKENMAFYGAESYIGHDSRPEEMAIEACLFLDDVIDFNDYDTDHNGVIDNVYIFYAGRGQASGGSPNTIWPHSADVYSSFKKTYRFDDVLLDHYATSNELDETATLSGIGTFCHEFSHVLGLPDLYATSSSTSFTPGSWSVMDYGPYCNNQHTPPLFSSYERLALGWLEPEELGTDPLTLSLEKISSSNKAYRISAPHNPNEYFLFENRQIDGWDMYLPGHGMLIWHIDYKPQTWEMNSVNNNASHQYVDLLEADDIRSDKTRAGDAFPGTAHVTEFTSSTQPGLVTWTYDYLDQPLTDIREIDGMIYFEYCGGNPPLQMNEPRVSATTPCTISLQWEPVADALGYRLTVYEGALSSGKQPLKDYDHLDLGDALQCTVEGLEFDSLYTLCLQSYDRIYNSLPQAIQVRTQVATFDYLTPVMSQIGVDAEGHVTASWNAMEDAVSYDVRFFARQFSEAERCTMDFTGGLDNLEGWTTNATTLYNSTAYSGEAVPSLQMSQDGLYLLSPVFADDIRSVSLWHRSSASTSSNLLVIEMLDASDKVITLDTIQVKRETGGTTLQYGEMAGSDIMLLHGRQLRISFLRSSNSNLALDDIIVEHGGSFSEVELQLKESLETETRYDAEVQTGDIIYAAVRARDASGLVSRWSVPVCVQVAAPSAIETLQHDAAPALFYDLSGRPVGPRLPARSGLFVRPDDHQGKATIVTIL